MLLNCIMTSNDVSSNLISAQSCENPDQTTQKQFDRKRRRKPSPHKITISVDNLDKPDSPICEEKPLEMLTTNLLKSNTTESSRSISDVVNSIINKSTLTDLQKNSLSSASCPLNVLTSGNLLPSNSSIQIRDLNTFVQFQNLLRQNQNGDLLGQATASQNSNFLKLMALQQQNFCSNNENALPLLPQADKEEFVNRSLIVNAMNLLMQSIPAPPAEVQGYSAINAAFNTVLLQALQFQQSVERYITQLQDGLVFSNYEKQVAACMAVAASAGAGVSLASTTHSAVTHLSDSSSSPNTSITEANHLNGNSTEHGAAVDLSLSLHEDGLTKSPLRPTDSLAISTKNALTLQNLGRIKKYGGKRSSPYQIVNGIPVKKTNFRGTSEEENEVDPNFRPIELPVS
ncbi:hypothetical protein Ciccas_008132 [Cichlidogyrus casuarinus]|uniref:Uncharacterized protein n=1 Tax=Cichlidogyrus casuarinus TaxID=1844966 RepID=A0ABD2Q0U4_9PLAT